MPIARPPQERVDAVTDRLLQAISEKNYDPFVVLDQADRDTLRDLCATDSPAADHLLQRLRAPARAADWPNNRADRLSLKIYAAAARQQATAEEEQRKQAEATIDASHRAGTRRRARKPLDMANGLDVEAL